MSVYIVPGVKVKVKQYAGLNPPHPLPLSNGFREEKEYVIIGMHCASETSEAYCILVNDYNQMWFISNRHLEIVSY